MHCKPWAWRGRYLPSSPSPFLPKPIVGLGKGETEWAALRNNALSCGQRPGKGCPQSRTPRGGDAHTCVLFTAPFRYLIFQDQMAIGCYVSGGEASVKAQ